MSDKIIKLTPAILKKIINEEREALFTESKRSKISSRKVLISEIKDLASLKRKQRYLIKRLKSIAKERKTITKSILKRRS